MSMKKFEKHLVTSRDKIKKNPSKVGQAAYDLLKKEHPTQTVEETIEAMTAKYYEKLFEAADEGRKSKNYPEIFYIIVERKKETLAGNVCNVLRHKYITSPFKPKSKLLREECPNSDFDVYEINQKRGEITLIYTLPTHQDSQTILKNRHLYDAQLVKWIELYQNGELDQAV